MVAKHKCRWRATPAAPVLIYGVRFMSQAVFCSRRACTQVAIASIHGDVALTDPVLVRLHSACLFGDTFRTKECDCYWQLRRSVSLFAERGSGILVYFVSHDGRGNGLATKVRSLAMMAESNVDTVQAFDLLGVAQDSRDYSAAAWFLASRSVKSIELLTNNMNKVDAMRRACASVHRVSLLSTRMSAEAKRQMRAKVEKLRHIDKELE